MDLETTGLNARRDYIVEAALISINSNKISISEAKNYKIHTPAYSKEAAQVHGVLRSEGNLSEPDALREISDLIRNQWLVGHHISFDYEMLHARCQAYAIDFLPKGLIDTQLLAIKADTGSTHLSELIAKKYSLDALCKRFDVQLEDAHTAAGDALATAILFLKLLKLYQSKKMLMPVMIP
ncbi:3'-5' exonuclease [Thermaurantimonas aggregans]|uniref:3'-5' exonuclease n=1 Tax=Thermaurantimonas aggregans TaxID=2173829 RepID=UPI001C3FDC9D|nr:3'-5' exonuclease [Thermaurantimonas aggregans]